MNETNRDAGATRPRPPSGPRLPPPSGPPLPPPPPPGPLLAVGAPAVTRPRRRWPWVVGATAALLLLVGAVVGLVLLLVDDAYDVAAWEAANPASPPSDPSELPRLDRHPCPFSAEPGGAEVSCATLYVPESRFDGPPTGVVAVAVAIVPARGGDRVDDPVLYLEGGPGESSVAWFDFWDEEGWPSMHDRDLILIDQRGTGYSTPTLACPELSASTTTDELEGLRSCHDRLVAEGRDLTAVSTREHAADVEDLRTTLGVGSWNLFGVSYGTRVALAVMDRHPDGIRSAVLDSVYPPEVDGLLEQNPAAHAAFGRLFDACSRDPGCEHAYGDLSAHLERAIAKLDVDPATIDGVELTGADLVFSLFLALYDTGFVPELPALIAEAAEDPDAALADLIGEDLDTRPGFAHRHRRPMAIPRGVPAYEASDGTFHSVECREEAAVTDVDATLERARAVPGRLGAALLVQLEHQLAVCGFWSSGAAGPDEKAPVTGQVPTLMLAGGLDPVTPASWARLAASRLDRAQLLEFDLAGHALFVADPCVVDVITGFVDRPDEPVDAVACVERLTEPRFTLPDDGP